MDWNLVKPEKKSIYLVELNFMPDRFNLHCELQELELSIGRQTLTDGS